MKHSWACLWFVIGGATGCGTSGEPIKGDIVIQYGADAPKFVVGSVVQDRGKPENMIVQIGSDNVDCDTYLDSFFSFDNPSGTFVYFSVDKATPGLHDGLAISVESSNGKHTSINEAQGTVTIDAIGARVTGSITFMTTDDMVGAISVTGGFDVRKCF